MYNKCAPGQIGTGLVGTEQMGTMTNGHRDKWAARQMSSETNGHGDKWAPTYKGWLCCHTKEVKVGEKVNVSFEFANVTLSINL